MPVYCTFTLDNRETSMLDCLGFGAVPAYSGHGKGRDNPNDVADVGVGPIPPGTYYIIDRQSGGDSDGLRHVRALVWYNRPSRVVHAVERQWRRHNQHQRYKARPLPPAS
ncbi:tlde1 domain-containing protein [Paraburkholderia terrae]|uniref:tlde1 domain-containing protein n=1 Tax=Paraburkholderia sp. 22B1P TaxID=3080498 RepID=UPI00285273B6|nr:tlde1 domain-containing protein [Paraburkholderia terrae]